MNVLSLFDGMGCGMIALLESGVKIDKYYASEVDKFAIQQTKYNFPNIIHLGDVRNIDVSKLDHIDLLIGGSPCQSFSFAGKQNGMSTTCKIYLYTLDQYLQLKDKNFEFEGQSYLFWEYIRILTEIRKYNPKIKFLLENVEMLKKWERTLSEAIGIYGIHINSSLVSAQNRRRIYWTNIKTKSVGLFGELHADIPQPADRGILLKDILQPNDQVNEKYFLSEKSQIALLKGIKGKQRTPENKAGYLTAGAHSGGNHSDMDVICVSMVGRRIDGNGIRKDTDKSIPAVQRLEPNTDGKTGCLTSVQKDNLITNGYKLRRLTPVECARLQTIPEWYKWTVSDTQIYKMLGNGWTVEVIKHIFSFL